MEKRGKTHIWVLTSIEIYETEVPNPNRDNELLFTFPFVVDVFEAIMLLT